MLITSRALPRRLLVASSGLVLAAASLTALSAPADAATTTTVTVVGTSDVYDSSLIQAVIAPGFRTADPQYKLNYVSEGTGKAITDAESGVADGLIVHAPSLENSFVAGIPISSTLTPPPAGESYSLEGPGRAIFYGDYIFAGATSDPANVDPDYPKPATDIVTAFQDVATAGAAGNANFVSRGGTPGTTVQEHLIWAQVPDSSSFTCNVSAANGGGAVPSTTNLGSDCPSTVTYPNWYHVTGLTQGPNIVNANTCNYPSSVSAGKNNCYVFTDRGTFDYLSEDSTSQTGNLEVVVRDSSADLLTNTFHAYAINPQAVGVETLNTAGATAFLNYLTSPDAQEAINNYLGDVDSVPPFKMDAAPEVATSKLPGTSPGGKAVTITGSLKNAVPGTPALNGIGVQLLAAPTTPAGSTFVPVASDNTDSSGAFSFTFTPKVDQTYKLFTPAITKVEYPDLTPTFKDTLQSTTTSLGRINVRGVVLNVVGTPSKGHLTVSGSVRPARTGDKATLTLYARPTGSSSAFAYHGRATLTAGGHSFKQTYALPKGKWDFYVKYANSGYISSGVSATSSVTVS